MSEVWIANASPVIVLAKSGYLDLLIALSTELLLPKMVVEEVAAGPPTDPARQRLEGGWGIIATPKAMSNELLEWGLGPGETAVLALAQERAPATAVLDDAAARTCAKVIGVPVIGTLGIILRARKYGLLPSAAEALKTVRNAGLHLDDETIRAALERIGENWT